MTLFDSFNLEFDQTNLLGQMPTTRHSWMLRWGLSRNQKKLAAGMQRSW